MCGSLWGLGCDIPSFQEACTHVILVAALLATMQRSLGLWLSSWLLSVSNCSHSSDVSGPRRLLDNYWFKLCMLAQDAASSSLRYPHDLQPTPEVGSNQQLSKCRGQVEPWETRKWFFVPQTNVNSWELVAAVRATLHKRRMSPASPNARRLIPNNNK